MTRVSLLPIFSPSSIPNHPMRTSIRGLRRGGRGGELSGVIPHCHSLSRRFAHTQYFDPTAQSYGHGNNKTGKETKSILHPDLKTIPHQPEVQLIGHGQVPGEYEGLDQVS